MAAEEAAKTGIAIPVESPTTWQTIKAYTGKVIDFVCAVRDIVKAYFSIAGRRYLRRQRRLFNQGKRLMTKGLFDWAKKVWNTVSNFFSTSAKRFQDAAAKFAGNVVAGLDAIKNDLVKLADFVHNILKGAFASIGAFFSTLRNNFVALFQSGKWNILQTFVACAGTIAGVVKDIKEKTGVATFLKFLALPARIVKLIALDPTEWLDFIIGLVCGWEKLGKAFDAFKLAWAAPGGQAKWENYGKGVGLIVGVLSG